jgi:hypothetical protein
MQQNQQQQRHEPQQHQQLQLQHQQQHQKQHQQQQEQSQQLLQQELLHHQQQQEELLQQQQQQQYHDLQQFHIQRERHMLALAADLRHLRSLSRDAPAWIADLMKLSALLSEESDDREGWGVRRMGGASGDVGIGWWGGGGALQGVGAVVGEGGRRMFVGEWLDGLPHGHGVLWTSAEQAAGQWVEGQFSGCGVVQTAAHVTAGSFVEGRADGWCVQLHNDGRVYRGSFSGGCLSGRAISFDASTGAEGAEGGRLFDGMFQGGLPHGEG